MSRFLYAVLLSSLFFLLSFIGCSPASKVDQTSFCDFELTPCQATLADGSMIRFDIEPRPIQPLSLLVLSVYLASGDDVDVTVDLTMPTMQMGRNHIVLQRQTMDGEHQPFTALYRSTGSIVKCISGERRWDALITIHPTLQSEAVPATVHFQFEVSK